MPTPPPVPALTIEPDSPAAAILLGVLVPAPTGGQPAGDHVDIYRSTDYGVTTVRVAKNLPLQCVVADLTPVAGVDYDYQAVTYTSGGLAAPSGYSLMSSVVADGGGSTVGVGFDFRDGTTALADTATSTIDGGGP